MSEFSNAKCPYWKQGGDYVVKCEGVVERQTHYFHFSRSGDRWKWSEGLCRGDWERCPWAKVLNVEYEKRDKKRKVNHEQ